MTDPRTLDEAAKNIRAERLVPVIETLARSAKASEITAGIEDAFGRSGEPDPADRQSREDASPPAATAAPPHPPAGEPTGDAAAARAYSLFKHLAHRGNDALWQALKEKLPQLDRDEVVLRLWTHLERNHRQTVELEAVSLPYHRLWLFTWFLGRYDLRRARRAAGGGAGGGAWAANLHLLLLVAVAGLFAVRQLGCLTGVPTRLSAAILAALYGLAVLALAARFRGKLAGGLPEALALALNSLVPRLAAAGVVGAVILASSQELLVLIAYRVPWGWLAAVLAAAYGYILLEMARRIHPLPGCGRLLLHGLDLWATALAHSLALALVAEVPLARVLDPGGTAGFGLAGSASVAVFIFVIGLVVNLIWAEQPVTEPL